MIPKERNLASIRNFTLPWVTFSNSHPLHWRQLAWLVKTAPTPTEVPAMGSWRGRHQFLGVDEWCFFAVSGTKHKKKEQQHKSGWLEQNRCWWWIVKFISGRVGYLNKLQLWSSLRKKQIQRDPFTLQHVRTSRGQLASPGYPFYRANGRCSRHSRVAVVFQDSPEFPGKDRWMLQHSQIWRLR